MSDANTINSTLNVTRDDQIVPFDENDTSPGQLQDVTMDNSNVLGYRSPIPHAGTSSPGQGRSIREFEEQMASLRKENFNLKLRIYFLEEKIPGYSSSNPDGHESIMKQNIELKVEMEILRKELQEKQSLLGEAAKALELMEQSQKETEEKSQAIIDDLYQKIQYLEMENKELEKCTASNQIEQIMGRTDITGDVEAMQKVRELEGCVKNSDLQIEELSGKINKLETLVSEKNEKINELEDTIKQLKFQNAELAEQLENKNKEIANAEMQNSESTKKLLQKIEDENGTLLCEHKNLLAMTKQLKIELEYEKHNSNEKDKKLKHQQKIMEEMQLTVLENMRHNTKQLKSISDYQKIIDDLRAEKRKLQKENSSLKEIIIKLEHLKWRQNVFREPEIYLGKSETSQKLFNRKNSVVPFSTCLQMANPLFHPKPHEKIDSNIGDNRYNSEYKLKEKFTASMNKKKQSIPSPHVDPRLYYREAKNYQNSYYEYLDANCDTQDLSIFPIKQGTTVNSATRAPLKEYTRSNSEENLLPCGSLLKISKSDSSIYSSSSQQTVKYKNCHEDKLAGNNFQDALQFSEKPKYPKLKEELYDHKKQLADKLCLLDEIESKLKEKTSAHEKLCKVIQQLMLNTRNLEMENSRLKDLSTGQNGSQLKEDFYSNQSTGMSKTTNDPDAVIEIAILKSKLDKLTEEKNAEINKLKLEIKKKTANLQNLVNTELWEKNREIERLTKLINKSNNSLPCSPVHEIDQLQLSFTDTEYYQALKRNKHLQEKVDILIQKLVNVSDRNTDPIIQQLKSEINEAREEADKANRWRKDCAEFCAILTSRLEELAGFLDSLLKQKDVLGALAADRRRAMRKAIDKSLDLSRSLNNNITLSISGISLAEHSLAQLSNISGILDSSLENKENKVSLKDQTELIENLKTEVKALKKELDRKRLTEYCKKERRSLPPLILDNQSESEAWSEPDRNVSLQRIGLENSVCANQNKKEENAVTSSESGTDTNRKSKSKAHEKINQLEHIISQHENRILEAHCELLKNDDKLKEENQRFMEINQELEEYKKVNGMLEIEIANYKSHFDKIIAEQENLKRNIEEKTSVITKITEERDQLHIEVRVSEMKIETLKTDIEEIKTKHQKEIANIEEREREKLNNLQREFLLKLEQKLKEQEEIQREQINREARHIYEEAKRKLDETNKQLVEAQSTIDYLRENEVELSNSLIDKEKSMRNLKKNLDESTLQASKAIIERTKVVKEKLLLESKIQELIAKLTALEEEKSNLTMKMSQLENMNSLLHKKILNYSKNNYTTTKHMSDGSHSGYTSEEVPMATRGATQRLENSSPDLGIESDAGRTSSVELSSAQAPMLKTIEIKGSIKEDAEADKKLQSNEVGNNPVDEENNNPQSSIISHDCAKVELENKELRRKLNRTKRAFEDTYRKLQEANQRKEQIERDIKHQILKTQNVLKNVRTNMESELEHNKKD